MSTILSVLVRSCAWALCLAVVTGTPAAAQVPADGDGHVWVQGVAVVPLESGWRLHLEGQPRWFDNASEPFQVLARGAVGRQLTSRMSLWGGYAWIGKPPGPGFAYEHRAWEQMLVTGPALGHWTTSGRWRQEQRWQRGWTGASHRTRLLVRAARPLTSRWSVIGWDEAMVTWNGTGRGPVRGFDQNRLFGGVGRRVSARLAVEGGYVWFALRPAAGVRVDSHVGLMTANLTF